MTSLRNIAIGAGLAALRVSRLHRLIAPLTRGRGAMLTFHHVRPWQNERFAPNRLLEITPRFLDQLLSHLKHAGYRVVRLHDVLPLLRSGQKEPPFVALTFDDGYRDSALQALPILEKHHAPFTVFVTTGFLDRTARLWWVELEAAIRNQTEIEVELGDRPRTFATRTAGEKNRAFTTVAEALLRGDDDQLLTAVAKLCRRSGVSGRAIVDQLCMDWGELERLASHPLATVGCHTNSHPRLSMLGAAKARDELVSSRKLIEDHIGRPIRHLCYPYGWRSAAGAREFELAGKLGFEVAVTTRPGVLFPEHAEYPTALPRVSVNGHWQNAASLDVLLSGAGFAIWNAGRHLDVA